MYVCVLAILRILDDLFNQLIIQFDIQYNILIKFTHFYQFPQSSLALETRLFILMFTELFVKILAKKKNQIEISLKYINICCQVYASKYSTLKGLIFASQVNLS